MKELDTDYLTGAILNVSGKRWRVLEIDPSTGRVRALLLDGGRVSLPMQRGLWSLPALRELIMSSIVVVE